jgi:hypothetical protein
VSDADLDRSIGFIQLNVSLPWFKKAWIIGQLYVMTAMVLFVMGGAAIIGNM